MLQEKTFDLIVSINRHGQSVKEKPEGVSCSYSLSADSLSDPETPGSS